MNAALTMPDRRAVDGEAPPARRSTRRSWRDPRLVLGVLLVATCTLLGARLLGSADDTVAVWVAVADIPAGSPVGSADLERRDVRFADVSLADRYLAAGAALPTGLVASRAVGAGEMVPRAALGRAPAEALVEVPVAAPVENVPATVRVGSLVDVWVTPASPQAAADAEAVMVLDDVPVVALPSAGSALAPSSTRQVIVGVPDGEAGSLASALAMLASGDVLLTRQG